MTERCHIGLLCLVALGAACASTTSAPEAPEHKSPQNIRIKVADSGPVRSIPLEEYVPVAALSEVTPDSRDVATGELMLELQTIIARTYAVAHLSRHGREGYDLCATTHCQLYDPRRAKTSFWADRALAATRRTSGVVLSYGGRPAAAVFHADCGGQTSAARDVWGSNAHPYLAGAADDGPAGAAHTAWRFVVTHDELVAALNRDLRTRVGKRLSHLAVTRRDPAGRATAIRLRGVQTRIVRGEELREVLTRSFGARALRSTRFGVERLGSRFVFEGRGFGHGVGLCQVGALARLRAGATPQQVLGQYYPGTTFVRIR
jgi:stage II sporulation protein D